jgi:hypothetical protein
MPYFKHWFPCCEANRISSLNRGRFDRSVKVGRIATASQIDRIRISHRIYQGYGFAGARFRLDLSNSGLAENNWNRPFLTNRTYSQVFVHWPFKMRRPKRSTLESVGLQWSQIEKSHVQWAWTELRRAETRIRVGSFILIVILRCECHALEYRMLKAVRSRSLRRAISMFLST